MLYRGIMEHTPVGALQIIAQDDFILRVDFAHQNAKEVDKYLTKWVGSAAISPGLSGELAKAMIQLAEYFDGLRQNFDLQVKMFGTGFQRRCWQALCQIPYGETVSYKTLAERAQSPKGFRAVGQANHNNPIAIIVPCHRVVASDRTLGGYGGGLENKRLLLELERANALGNKPIA